MEISTTATRPRMEAVAGTTWNADAYYIDGKAYYQRRYGPETRAYAAREKAAHDALNVPGVLPMAQFISGSTITHEFPYISGQSLKTKIGLGPLPLYLVTGIVKEAASILTAAQERGVFAQDVSARRWRIDRDSGDLVYTGWNCAHILKEPELSKPFELRSDRAYVPRQKFENQTEADRKRNETYGLAVLAFHLLTHAFPRSREDIMRNSYRLLNSLPAAHQDITNFANPIKLNDAIARALHQRPSKRTRTPVEFAEEFEAATKFKGMFEPYRRATFP